MPSVILAGTTSTTALNLTGDTSGELQIQTNNGSTTAMTLTTGGNVGVGTTTPLQTSSNRVVTTVNGTLSALVNLGVGGTATGLYYADASNVVLGATTNIPLLFNTNNTERMRIDSTGKVGIGTSSPAVPLDIVADSTSVGVNIRGRSLDNVGSLRISSNNGSVNYAFISASSSTLTIRSVSAQPILFDINNTERMRIDSSGRVGIGCTPAPWDTFNALEVNGATVAGIPANQAVFGNNVYYASSNFRYVASAPSQIYQQGASGHFWYSAPSGTANNAFSPTTVLSTALNNTLALQGASYATGTGITFPATQSASSDANTLDDYEEGTFTPTVIGLNTAGTTSYTQQTGSYTKIGRVVTVAFKVAYTAATGIGALAIRGFPFAGAGASAEYIGSVMTDALDTPSNGSFAIYLNSGSSGVEVYVSTDNASLTAVNLSNENASIWGTITYFSA